VAEYRNIQCKFWKDSQVMDNFTPEDKLFWIYLLTNEYTTLIGVYKFIKKIVAFEIGYSVETIDNLIKRFETFHKLIKYDNDTKEVAILNWGKYNLRKGGRPIICCIESEIKKIENKSLIKLVAYNSKEHVSKDILEVLLKYNIDINIKMDIDIDMYMEMEMEMKHVGVVASEHVDEHVKKDECIADKIMKLWNEVCISYQKVVMISSSRKEMIDNIYSSLKDIELIKQAFVKIEASSFCKGDNEKKWKASFDWIISNDTNLIKVLEGKYDNAKTYFDKLREEGDPYE
jgi:hypothetical protein